MPTYPNPSGGSMEAANDAAARAMGWTPSMGTFGINTYPDSGGSSSGGGGGGGILQSAYPGGGGDGLDQARAFARETAGFSREELAQRADQFNKQMQLIEAQWEREGKPRLQIDQDLQQLRRWQAEQDIALQGRALDLQTEIQRGGLDLQRGQLGLSYLDTASKMGGPSDYFNSVDFFRGASQRGDVPVFLSSLANNTQLPAFQAAGSIAQNPMTAAGLTQKLTGAAPPSMYNADQALAQIGSIFKAGPTSLSRGSLEALDPNELALLKACGQKLGYDPDQWLRAYSNAGIGQSSTKTY
jgi:hypothetical protein